MMTVRRFSVIDAADRLALVTSAACLIHCLALPLLFAALPILSHVLYLPESFHLWMVAVAVPTSAYALLKGRRRHLNSTIVFGVVGLSLLVIGTTIAGETRYEVPITVVGAVILSIAHVLNWRRRHGKA